ncbi:MAG: OprO/OprP family phosphate-selective porin [Burkholderiales bacterium]
MFRRSAVALSVALLCATFAVLMPGSARAQAPESELPPEPGAFEGRIPPPVPGALLPDVPASTYDATRVSTPGFTLKPGLVLLADYTFFRQDAASLAQVGEQDNLGQLRAARLMMRGTIGTGYVVRYLVAGEYKGFDTAYDKNWDMTDVSLTFPLRGPSTTLTVGKTKESFAYEMVGDAANLAFQERVLSPFFVSRAVGARIAHVTEDRLSTVSFGVFNDSWGGSSAKGPNDGTDVTLRVTRALWLKDGGRRLMHVGGSVRRAGADGGTLRYRGRPESNVSDFYVDTGTFAAERALHLGLEALWQQGPWSVIGEWVHAKVDAPRSGDPSFSGGYLGVSWVVTGESRPYDTSVGYARRVQPSGANGALELVARASRVDLDDGAVQGGRFVKSYLGANWWATPRLKFGGGWGRTWLDDAGTRGVTDAVLLRAQWVY